MTKLFPSIIFSVSSTLFAARLAAAALTLLTQILLTRLMAPELLGEYFLITSLVTVLAVFAAGGYPNISNRVLASFRVAPRRQNAAVFTRSISRTITFRASLLVIVAALSFTWASNAISPPYLMATVAVPALALSLFWGSVLNGERRFMWAALPDLILRPVLFLLVVLIFGASETPLAPAQLVFVFSTLLVLVAGIQLFALKGQFPNLTTASTADSRQSRLWSKLAVPLVALSLFANFFGDVAIAYSGFFLSPSELAPLAIAIKVALLIGFFIQVSHQIAIPDLSDAVRHSNPTAIRERLRRVNCTALIYAVSAFGLLWLYGRQLLSVFGPEYEAAEQLLLIIAAGQVVRALAGPAGQMLVIVGRQRIVLAVTVTSFLVLALANAILVPVLGAIGAAISVAMTYTFWHVVNAIALTRVSELRGHFMPIADFANVALIQQKLSHLIPSRG